MLKPEMVPMEVVEAYVKAYESYPPKSRQECIAAAINAWPGVEHRPGAKVTETYSDPGKIILPHDGAARMSESETDIEFVSDMEWLHSHDREAALPPEKLIRLFALARRGAETAAEIERLKAALRFYAAWPTSLAANVIPYLLDAGKTARAALKEDGDA